VVLVVREVAGSGGWESEAVRVVLLASTREIVQVEGGMVKVVGELTR
jgi:hypothetical protein